MRWTSEIRAGLNLLIFMLFLKSFAYRPISSYVTNDVFRKSYFSNAFAVSSTTNLQDWNFLPSHLKNKAERRLDLDTTNPVGIVTKYIQQFFETSDLKLPYLSIPSAPVSIFDNFDRLFVPYTHISREPSESYYISSEYANNYRKLLSEYRNHAIDSLSLDDLKRLSDTWNHSHRLMPTHTTFYLPYLLSQGVSTSIYSGQVWRRDSIDSLHYPVFHQLDGFYLGTDGGNIAKLKAILENLVKFLFSKTKTQFEIEWKDDDFPFTNPSFEMFIRVDNTPIEILGCGVIKPHIIANNWSGGSSDTLGGWAFGIGLERLCMALFGIPDIRLFWEKDERFTSQFANVFQNDAFDKFVKYSNNPAVVRDISFFVPVKYAEDFQKLQNEFIGIVEEVGEDLVESIKLVDVYQKKDSRGLGNTSLCFRITYRDFKNLTNAEVNDVHANVVSKASEQLGITAR